MVFAVHLHLKKKNPPRCIHCHSASFSNMTPPTLEPASALSREDVVEVLHRSGLHCVTGHIWRSALTHAGHGQTLHNLIIVFAVFPREALLRLAPQSRGGDPACQPAVERHLGGVIMLPSRRSVFVISRKILARRRESTFSEVSRKFEA